MYTMKGCDIVNMHFDIFLNFYIDIYICLHNHSTIKTAREYNIPIKTLEKWITAFNKDNHCFDSKVEVVNDFKIINNSRPEDDYDDLSPDDFKTILMKKDIEIARLKKGYLVKGGGTEKKVFVTFSKKNTK